MYGLQSSNYRLLTELNHNDMGNPHPQYVQKDYMTSALSSSTNQWTKIMSTSFNATYPESMMFNILLNISSTNGSVNGLLTLQGTHVGDTSYFKLSYLDNIATTKKDYLNMFALYKRLNSDNTTYTYELWVSSFQSSTQLIITPLVNVCYPQQWSAFLGNLDYKMIIKDNMYFENQSFITETELKSGATLITKNAIQNAILYFNTQSDVKSQDVSDMSCYYGKIVNVAGVNYSIKSATVLVPLDFQSKATTITTTGTSVTVDVSSNNCNLTFTPDSNGTITVANFSNAYEGQEITVYCSNTGTVTLLYGSSTLKLKNSINATIPQYQYIMLRKFGGVWLEYYRSF